jgi:hypothetical protein
MASATPAITTLVQQRNLGPIVRCYGPGTVGKVVVSLLAIAAGVAWGLGAAALTGSDLVPATMNPFPVNQPLNDPGLARYFPLFGLAFVVFGVFFLLRTILNAGSRVALCVHGVAIASPKVTDVFTWPDVLTVTHRIDVQRSTTRWASGMSSTTTSTRHRFTVHCRDGRAIVLDSRLIGGRVQDLAGQIEVQAARAGDARR